MKSQILKVSEHRVGIICHRVGGIHNNSFSFHQKGGVIPPAVQSRRLLGDLITWVPQNTGPRGVWEARSPENPCNFDHLSFNHRTHALHVSLLKCRKKCDLSLYKWCNFLFIFVFVFQKYVGVTNFTYNEIRNFFGGFFSSVTFSYCS